VTWGDARGGLSGERVPAQPRGVYMLWPPASRRSTGSDPTAAGNQTKDQGNPTGARGVRLVASLFTLGALVAVGVACPGSNPPDLVSVTVTTTESGTQVTVDGTTVSAPHREDWEDGSRHGIGVPSPQGGPAGVRYRYESWSDGGAQSHDVTAVSGATFTATLAAEYQMSVAASPSGAGGVEVDPAGPWYASGTAVEVTATPEAGWTFDHWDGDLSGSVNPETVTMDAACSLTAVFAAVTHAVTVTTSEGAGTQVEVDGGAVDAPYATDWQEGAVHSISVPSPQSAGAGVRYLHESWSDGGTQTHDVSVASDSTFTAALGTEYELSMAVSPTGSGTVDLDPAGPWYASGESVDLTAAPETGWAFDHWEGDLSGATNPETLAMDGPQSATAVFVALPGSVSGRAHHAGDDSPLDGRAMLLIQGADTTSTVTDGNGDYAFTDVEPGDYTVVADTTGLTLFGRFEPGQEQSVTVGPGEDVAGIDFSYRMARITVRTLVTTTPFSTGTADTISLELDVSEIPLPIASLGGDITWDAAVADFTEGSEAGAVWDIVVVNEDPAGTLKFSAISAAGVADDTLLALTFEITATGVGSTELDPTLTELTAIDPDTGTSIDLLPITTLVEERATVTVQ
jgi:hypothetical protein